MVGKLKFALQKLFTTEKLNKDNHVVCLCPFSHKYSNFLLTFFLILSIVLPACTSSTPQPISQQATPTNTTTLIPTETDAITPHVTSTPAPPLTLLPCLHPETVTWAGPWSVEGQTYWAALTWRENEKEACLALLETNSGEIAAQGQIEAGYSERYDEWSAPGFSPLEPILLPGEPPFIVTGRQAQGAGGGGGELYTVWRSVEGELVSVLGFSLESYTNINTLMEAPCPGRLNYYRQQGNELEVDSCFDGQPQTQRYQFDGEQFILLSEESEIN